MVVQLAGRGQTQGLGDVGRRADAAEDLLQDLQADGVPEGRQRCRDLLPRGVQDLTAGARLLPLHRDIAYQGDRADQHDDAVGDGLLGLTLALQLLQGPEGPWR